MTNFDKVGTFMKTFGQEVKTKPSFSTDKINKLRLDSAVNVGILGIKLFLSFLINLYQ